MPGHDIIVIGFSAGEVEALTRIIPDLPVGFPAAILIVHHFPAHSTSALPRILNRLGRLPATHGVDGSGFGLGTSTSPARSGISWSTATGFSFHAAPGKMDTGPPSTRSSALQPAAMGRE
jgi:CheB methylesterase